MSKQQKRVQHKSKPFTPAAGSQAAKKNSFFSSPLSVSVLILILTFISFFPTLKNDFQSQWDDQAYVTKNELIKDFSLNGIKRIFKEDKGLYANYHPVTTLSLALNYKVSGATPFAYHFTNLLIHLANTILVFVFINFLTDKKILVAGITSLWFGIHPMHVESVAWISERKDVLYSFFFLLSATCYLKHIREGGFKWYPASLFLFTLGVLSKAMAVSLVPVLILLDWLYKRKFHRNLVIEKIPYLIIALILGWYAVQIQAAGGATSSELFSVYHRTLHGFYAFVLYLWKMILPVNLSAFYPYPYPLTHGAWVLDKIPAVFYTTLLISILIISLVLYLFTRKDPLARKTAFGFLFYGATIALVLQFIPVGRAAIADRYSYLPYIGLFYAVGELIFFLLYHPKPERRVQGKALLSGVLVISVAFMLLSYQRSIVWKNSETLWGDVIKKYPDDPRVVMAWFNRATWYYENNKPEAALNDFLSILRLDPNDVNSLERVGKIYGKEMGDLDKSIAYLEKAYSLDQKNTDVLLGLGTAYGIKGEHHKSLFYSVQAEKIVPELSSLLMNMAASYQFLGDTAKAKEYFEKSKKK